MGAWSSLAMALRPSDPQPAQRFNMGELTKLIYEAQSSPNVLLPFQTWGTDARHEQIGADFASYAERLFKANGPVWSLIAVRTLIFSQAEFAFEDRITRKRFTTAALRVLERPWPNGSTVELLARMLVDHDLSGNFYGYVTDGRIRRLRPDRVQIVLGGDGPSDEEPSEADADLVGYLYMPPGRSRMPVPILPSEMVHFASIPDPTAWYRGTSWLSAVLDEVQGDKAATAHKLAFFRNGATPNMVVSFDPAAFKNAEEFNAAIEALDKATAGVSNAYRSLYLRGATKVDVVGVNMRDLDLKALQGAGESRLASAAGVPVPIVGFSEGLQGSSLNTGNYGAARRRLADGTIRPLWSAAASALETAAVPPNSGSRLVVDDSRVAFVREDRLDEAQVRATEAQTIRQLIDAGYQPDTVPDAVITGDWSKLKHSNLYSVQLQPPGASQQPASPAA